MSWLMLTSVPSRFRLKSQTKKTSSPPHKLSYHTPTHAEDFSCRWAIEERCGCVLHSSPLPSMSDCQRIIMSLSLEENYTVLENLLSA